MTLFANNTIHLWGFEGFEIVSNFNEKLDDGLVKKHAYPEDLIWSYLLYGVMVWWSYM